MNTRSEYFAEQFLDHLRRETREASEAWRQGVLFPIEPESVSVRLYVPSERATPAALALYDFDREIRRATRLLQTEFRSVADRTSFWRGSPPIRVHAGGFALESAETGSADFLLAAYGAVAQALLSDPVQVTLTAKELLGWPGRLAVSVKRMLGPERRVYEQKGSFRVEAGDKGISVEDVPEGTRVVVRQKTADGIVTTIDVTR